MSDWREELVRMLARVLGVSARAATPHRAPDPTAPSSAGQLDWPPLPDVGASDERLEFWKLRYASELQETADRRKGLDPVRSDTEKAEGAHDFAVRLEIVKAYLDVAKAAPERSKAAAQFVQTAASAVGTIYTGLLALSFSGAASAVRLDPRALAPGLFLGLAIVLATAFLAFITHGRPSKAPEGSGDLETAQAARLNAFIEWSRELVLRRVYFLRAGVISLGLGVALLPVPLIDPHQLSTRAVGWLSAFGLAFTLVVPSLYSVARRASKALSGWILPTLGRR
jgi:hypothetical protein